MPQPIAASQSFLGSDSLLRYRTVIRILSQRIKSLSLNIRFLSKSRRSRTVSTLLVRKGLWSGEVASSEEALMLRTADSIWNWVTRIY